MFSKACTYAIKATLVVARHSGDGGHVPLKIIAEEIGTPVAFTAKILQKLSGESIITSVRGQEGGYMIPVASQKRIRLIQIVDAFDGQELYTACVLGLEHCSDAHPCPVHDQYNVLRARLRAMLENTTIFSLLKALSRGQSFIKS